jgi:hypothetical protein
VVALAQGHIPARCRHVSGINRPRQQARDILIEHDACPSLRELRSRLQEPLHLGLDLEAPRRIAFERLLHKGSRVCKRNLMLCSLRTILSFDRCFPRAPRGANFALSHCRRPLRWVFLSTLIATVAVACSSAKPSDRTRSGGAVGDSRGISFIARRRSAWRVTALALTAFVLFPMPYFSLAQSNTRVHRFTKPRDSYNRSGDEV